MSIFAYLDAGTGSIIIQTIVGGVAAIGVVARLYWSRIKRLFGRGAEPAPDAAPARREP